VHVSLRRGRGRGVEEGGLKVGGGRRVEDGGRVGGSPDERGISFTYNFEGGQEAESISDSSTNPRPEPGTSEAYGNPFTSSSTPKTNSKPAKF
jgi:hypothetical protein